ncbi:MAG: alpha/beta hydrolase-fold protein, partial [Thermoleophilaceae bacterium]
MRRLLAACALALILAPAAAAELPSVESGQRPGPPLLYEPPPDAPQLSVQAPFAAPPLLVSGTDAYRQGEYQYQDYLFDDRGADTVPGSGSRGDPGSDVAASTAGDVLYPTAARYAGNAADIVELRIKPTAEAIVYRVTLDTVLAGDAAVVGIGIDTDRSGGAPVPWPLGAGVSSPGLDTFITAFGTGGKVTALPAGTTTDLPAGAVSIDTTTNQMTIRVPRSTMDPGGATWRYVAGAGLWDGAAWKPVPPGSEPTEEGSASGNPALPAPAVFNLAFRFAEPQSKNPMPPYTTFPGVGIWFEDQQSRALAAGVTDCSFGGAPAGCRPFHADVDFAKLAAGVNEQLHSPPGREQARIMSSELDLPEGVRAEFPAYGGRLQPYILTVPPGYDPARPSGLTFALHSLGGTYTQFAVFSPNQLRQFGDQRDNLVVTPHARGTDGWYTDEAEVDVFEVWRDVARHFSLDPDRVALSGYSMGGYGTYKLGTQYPDLFGRAFTTVGPPAREVWIPPNDPVILSEGGTPNASSNSNIVLENARWLPFMNWVEVADELVPYVGPRAQQARFDELGLRSQLWSFAPGEHFTLAVVDEWEAARDFLGEARVVRDPWRVNYAFVPAADRPALGLVHDHAYWVSGLLARDTSGDPGTDPSRGEIDARSLAFGVGDPGTRAVRSAGPPAPPGLSAVEGTEWTSTPPRPRRNALSLRLENVSAATIVGRRARLDGGRRLRVTLES